MAINEYVIIFIMSLLKASCSCLKNKEVLHIICLLTQPSAYLGLVVRSQTIICVKCLHPVCRFKWWCYKCNRLYIRVNWNSYEDRYLCPLPYIISSTTKILHVHVYMLVMQYAYQSTWMLVMYVVNIGTCKCIIYL